MCSFSFRIALPLATPVVAVMVLFNVVGIWNGYFSGLLYLSKPELFNFQMVLRDILFAAKLPPEMMMSIDPRQFAIMTRFLQQLTLFCPCSGRTAHDDPLPLYPEILYPGNDDRLVKGIGWGKELPGNYIALCVV